MKSILVLFIVASASMAQSWEPCAPLPSLRYSGAALALDGKVYYVGGSVTGGLKTNTVFVYDTATGSWSTGDSMRIARHRFGAAALDGKLYVFGGWGNGGALLNSGECYDTGTRQWSAIETLPSGRASVFSGAVRFPLSRVICAGGWTGAEALAQTLAYDPTTWHWQQRTSMPVALGEGMCASDGDALYCAGGTPDGGPRLRRSAFTRRHMTNGIPSGRQCRPREWAGPGRRTTGASG